MHFVLPRVDTISLLLFWLSFLSCGTYGSPLVCLDHFKCELGVEKTTVACSDPGIDVVPLCLNPSLISLTLQNTRIHTLYLTSFRYYADLKYVNLSQNKINKIEKKTFEYQQKLEELHLADNKISHLDVEVLFGLRNLTVLSLRGNLLEEIPNAVFHQVPNLEHLDLSHNRLTVLDESVFTGIPKLVVLSVSLNKLTNVPGVSFKPVPHLSELSLGGNPYSGIESRDFELLPALDSLDLSNTDLKNGLLADTFHFLSGLRILKLDDCQLPSIPTVSLYALPILEELHLSRNQFADVPRDAFRGNTRLTSLIITGCPHFERVSPGALKNNLNLAHLELSHNPNLTYVPPDEFRFLTLLSYLDLHGNNLQYIPYSAVSWEEVNKWYLHYNPITCNCSAEWLRKLLVKVNHTSPSVKCAAPPDLRGISLESPELNDRLCGLDTTTQGIIIALSLCILLTIVVCIAFFFLYRHRGLCLRQVLKRKQWERNGRGPHHRSYDSDYPCIKPVPVTEL